MLESTGVVQGIYLGNIYKKISGGEIVTTSLFKLTKTIGINQNEIINKNKFEIVQFGGVWQGIVYEVTGTPTFKVGEEVLLLVSKGKLGNQLTNSALGKYTIKRRMGETYYSSSVFPGHKQLGSISSRKLEATAQEVFGTGLMAISQDKYVHKTKSDSPNYKKYKKYKKKRLRKGRYIASYEEKEDREKGSASSTFWLVAILVCLGIIYHLIIKNEGKNN